MLSHLRHRAFALLALLAFALGATGHAHRAPSIAEEMLAGYMRAGLVTLGDICGMEGMGEATADCPLCRVEPGYLPPEPLRGCAEVTFALIGLNPALARYPAPRRVPAFDNVPRAPPIA